MKILQICPPHLSNVATSDYLGYFRRKQTVIPTCHTPKHVTALTCELQNFFIWLKVCCVLSNVGGSEESQLWVVVGGSEKNRLWCVATGMSGKQRHSKCSEWPPSALVNASSLFDTDQSHSTPRCAKIQPMQQQAAATSLNIVIHINTCTPPVAYSRCSTKAMQLIRSTKQQ